MMTRILLSIVMLASAFSSDAAAQPNQGPANATAQIAAVASGGSSAEQAYDNEAASQPAAKARSKRSVKRLYRSTDRQAPTSRQ